MSQAQYVIPGEDFHDEEVDEGQFVNPGQSFIDQSDDNVPPITINQSAFLVFF